MANFTECDSTPFPLSDHEKVVLHFDSSQFKSDPGIWQLNSSVLCDSAYVSEMNNLMDELVDKRGSSDSPANWWEELKWAFADFSKKFCANCAEPRRSKKSKLLQQLRNADRKEQRTGNSHFSLLAKQISNEIWEIEISEAEGTKVRAKAKWCEEGEKVTRYFCSLEKQRQGDRNMASVKTKEGNIQKTPDGILKTVKEFYKDLYTAEAREESATNTLLGKVSRKLKRKEQERCEGPILEKELKLSLKQAKNGKSSGSERIPVEFC